MQLPIISLNSMTNQEPSVHIGEPVGTFLFQTTMAPFDDIVEHLGGSASW